MAFRARYTPEASAIIKKLHPTIKAAVRAGITEIVHDPLDGRELQLELQGFRSLRVGRHRIIYRIKRKRPALRSIMWAPVAMCTKVSEIFYPERCRFDRPFSRMVSRPVRPEEARRACHFDRLSAQPEAARRAVSKG